MDFRKDINGLRAVAVLVVVLYHFGFSAFAGGFVGVDVFFVISGYLMTAIILGKVDQDRFSLTDFYLARARRILPALVVVSVVVMLFGWFWMVPTAYKLLGQEIASAVVFLSNFHFREATGYFSASNDYWMLHTWSLSVEWQFYLMYPVLLMAWFRFAGRSTRRLTGLLVTGAVVSLLWSIWLSGQSPKSAFYFLPARAWELLAGGVVLLASRRWPLAKPAGVAVLVVGLSMVAAAAMLFNPSLLWPGYAAMLPVFGACLVIFAGRTEAVWAGNPVFSSLGRWSYSIYLVHWPLVVALGYFGVKGEMMWQGLALAATVLLGAASYRWVEVPSRKMASGWSARRATAVFSGVVIVILTLGGAIFTLNGIGWRVPEAVRIADAEKENSHHLQNCNTKDRINLPECVLGTRQMRALVWGDSHASATARAIGEAAQAAGGGVMLYYKAGCPVVFGARSSDPSADPTHACERFNDVVSARVNARHPNLPVIVMTRGSGYAGNMTFKGSVAETAEQRADEYYRHLTASLCTIATDRPVYAVLPIPQMPVDVPKTMALNAMLTGQVEEVSVPETAYLTDHRQARHAIEQASRQCGVKLLDPAPYLCKNGQCRGAINGRPLYTDNNHLSEYGNRFLVPMFSQVFQNENR